MYATFDEARSALTEAHLDVTADHGEEAAWQFHNDLVRTICADCTPEVAEELARREGVQL